MNPRLQSPNGHRVTLSIILILLYIATVLTAAFIATAIQPGGPF